MALNNRIPSMHVAVFLLRKRNVLKPKLISSLYQKQSDCSLQFFLMLIGLAITDYYRLSQAMHQGSIETYIENLPCKGDGRNKNKQINKISLRVFTSNKNV